VLPTVTGTTQPVVVLVTQSTQWASAASQAVIDLLPQVAAE
jgi:hypothetical protein